MRRFLTHANIVTFAGMLSINVCAATVVWNEAFVIYEGMDVSTGSYERYTLGKPYLNMGARRTGSTLEVWAFPEANALEANTFIEVYYIPGRWTASRDLIYNSQSYFAYATYTDSGDGYEERADYSIFLDEGESVYLAFGHQPNNTTDPTTFGWVQLGLDENGRLTVISSAWDIDGDPVLIGPIPESSSGLLLLVGGALLALRRRRHGNPARADGAVPD